MILVDTSVWVDHLRRGDATLAEKLEVGQVACHPFIIGELACGNLRKRDEILVLFGALPRVSVVEPEEVLAFIDAKKLMGKGLGYIDVHLLASAVLDDVTLWSADKRLDQIARKLGVAYKP